MLTILSTHPIQYQTPIWRRLAERGNVPFRVLFMSQQGLRARHDPGFGQAVAWDVDLLEGYPHEFLPVIEGARQNSMLWLRLGRAFGARLGELEATTLWIQGWQVLAYWQAVHHARRRGIPVWLRGETNMKSSAAGLRQSLKDPLFSWLFSRVDRFLCIGEANRAFYRARGIADERLADGPYCVDNDRFRNASSAARPKRETLRDAWGVPSNAFCVLFVGKLIPKKRPLDLIAASRRLRALRPDLPLHLVFVGSGELAEAARAQCRVLYDSERPDASPSNRDPNAPRASFVGFVNQSRLPEAYCAADCVALPSEATETWGLVVNEAMACGTPSVVSDAVGCGDDLVRPIDPAFVFPLGDVDAQARALARMAESPPAAEDLAQRIERFDPLRTVETVERLYHEGLSKR